MITGTEVYWITRFDALHALALVTGLLCLIVIISITGIYCIACKEGKEKRALPYLWFLFVPFIILVGSIFIPTTKEMCAIKAIPMIANNEQVQELPNKVLELANEWIDELNQPKNQNK